jgi:hypothetical protein
VLDNKSAADHKRLCEYLPTSMASFCISSLCALLVVLHPLDTCRLPYQLPSPELCIRSSVVVLVVRHGWSLPSSFSSLFSTAISNLVDGGNVDVYAGYSEMSVSPTTPARSGQLQGGKEAERLNGASFGIS